MIGVKKLDPRAKNPSRAHATDAGWDLFALDGHYLYPGYPPEKIRTGIALSIPIGHVGIISPRSSLGAKGVQIYGGIIDSGYRGEIIAMLALTTHGADMYHILPGDKIAQLVVHKLYDEVMWEVTELSPSDRGDGGFGSTGK